MSKEVFHAHTSFFNPTNIDIDRDGSLCYIDPISGRLNLLEPAKPITDKALMIAKIGQQNLLPGHFTLKPKDFEYTFVTDEDGNMVGEPILPGVSSIVYWGSQCTRQDSLNAITETHLGRSSSSKNRLYISQVGDILGAGWFPYFAPLINRKLAFPVYSPLHVILVPASFHYDESARDATDFEKKALAATFIKWT